MPPRTRSSFALGTRSYELGTGSLLSNTFRYLLYLPLVFLSFNYAAYLLTYTDLYTKKKLRQPSIYLGNIGKVLLNYLYYR